MLSGIEPTTVNATQQRTKKLFSQLSIGDHIEFKPINFAEESDRINYIRPKAVHYATIIEIDKPNRMLKLSVGWLKPINRGVKITVLPPKPEDRSTAPQKSKTKPKTFGKSHIPID